MKKTTYFLFPLLLGAFFLSGCRSALFSSDPDQIVSINIVDRNGLTETISAKERLQNFQKTDFNAPQPYQKVMRVFGRDKNGNMRAVLTSYHPNGQIKQYLESVNQRASGIYKEWHTNGQLKIEANVIGGVADLNSQSEGSWLFDGVSRAWDEDGLLIAEINYEQGEMQGDAFYYHSNGSLWKICPYKNGLLHGSQKTFLANGSLLQIVEYKAGLKEGLSTRHWTPFQKAFEELYVNGRLEEATYFDKESSCVAQIHQGKGFRAIFGKNDLQSLQEFNQGIQEGIVKIFDEKQRLIRSFYIKDGEKDGEEIDYYLTTPPQPRLLMTWHKGALQGPAKTWYENGNLESQREMSENKKNGLSTAWYENGSLMLVEEYEDDRLVKGEYFRLGETLPATKIDKGAGIATLFSSDGSTSRKVAYEDGKPID